MNYGIWSCIPILVLIIGGFATKRMTEMIVASSLIGSVILYKTHFFKGFVDLIYTVLSDDSFQFVLVLLMGVGAMMKLFERSGALAGFQKLIERLAYSRKRALLTTWLLCIVMFIDDYLNLLSVSNTMKNVTDRYKVPREHLAYTLNSMGVSVCLLIPCTSWSVFAVTHMSRQGLKYIDYIKAIPFMFFPAASVVVSLLLIVGVIPKCGGLKKAYQRVETEGTVLALPHKDGAFVVDTDSEEENKCIEPSSVLNFFIPMITLIAVMFIFNMQIQYGIVAGLFCMLVLYKVQKLMTVGEFFNSFFDGIKEMSSIAVVVLFAYMIAKENELLGFAPFIVGNCVKWITPKVLPLFIFVIMSLVAFSIGDVWALILITMPIFIPMAQKMGVNASIAVGALLSGANVGAITCLQSDALFMTFAGTGVGNITQIKTGFPYIALAAGAAAIGFLITGLI